MLDESFDEARSRGYSFIAHNIAYNDAWTRLHTMTPGIDDRIVEIASEPGPEVITNMLEIARSWGLRARGDLVGALDTIERVELDLFSDDQREGALAAARSSSPKSCSSSGASTRPRR